MLTRIAGVLCICMWGYFVLFGGATAHLYQYHTSAVQVVNVLGIEFSHEQLKSVLLIMLLPLGLLLWALGDYRPSKFKK